MSVGALKHQVGLCLPSQLKAIICREQKHQKCGSIPVKYTSRKYGLSLINISAFASEMFNNSCTFGGSFLPRILYVQMSFHHCVTGSLYMFY